MLFHRPDADVLDIQVGHLVHIGYDVHAFLNFFELKAIVDIADHFVNLVDSIGLVQQSDHGISSVNGEGVSRSHLVFDLWSNGVGRCLHVTGRKKLVNIKCKIIDNLVRKHCMYHFSIGFKFDKLNCLLGNGLLLRNDLLKLSSGVLFELLVKRICLLFGTV